MSWKNDTAVKEFILLGLTSNPKAQIVFFGVFLIMYAIILTGNSLIITVTLADDHLQTPMYFFITNLAFLDIWYSSSVVPRMLRDLVVAEKTISFSECAAQMYISLSFGETECILLAIMAYDRYVAICYPLHYTAIINRSVCIKLATGTWICGFIFSAPPLIFVLIMNFCDSNIINHFVCELPEVISLGCDNNIFIEFLFFIVGVIMLIIPVIFIITSYLKIIIAILKISSSSGQQKAFSTCGSHIMVVTLFYGSAMAIYMKPRSNYSPKIDKLIAVFYSIVTPMLNPLVYTLRNKNVKTALRKVCIRQLILQKN
ncbi:olfactory receptor 13F1-like [Discoglossus pictus]